MASGLTRDQIDILQARHERLARELTIVLAPLVRGMVEIKVTGVAAQRYSEFNDGLDNPTCLSVLTATPLEEKLLLEISPAIAFPMIDRMLGGGRERTIVARRPLTAIEQRLMNRVVGLFAQELRRSCEKSIQLEPAIQSMVTNPQLVQILSPHEPIGVIKFEIAIGEAHGKMRFCLPLSAISAITRPPSARSSCCSNDGPSVEVSVQLARTTIGAAEAAGLAVGDILATDMTTASPLVLTIDGIPRFHGHPGAFQGRKAVQVETAIDESAADGLTRDNKLADAPEQ